MTQRTVRPSLAARATATVGIAACLLLRAPATFAQAEESTWSAADSSAAAASFQPEVNGCGPAQGLTNHLIPNAIPSIFDFTVACNQHDACYGLSVDRAFCDQ